MGRNNDSLQPANWGKLNLSESKKAIQALTNSVDPKSRSLFSALAQLIQKVAEDQYGDSSDPKYIKIANLITKKVTAELSSVSVDDTQLKSLEAKQQTLIDQLKSYLDKQAKADSTNTQDALDDAADKIISEIVQALNSKRSKNSERSVADVKKMLQGIVSSSKTSAASSRQATLNNVKQFATVQQKLANVSKIQAELDKAATENFHRTTEQISGAIDSINSLHDKLNLGFFTRIFSGILGTIKNIIGGVWRMMKGAFNALIVKPLKFIKGLASKIWDGLKSMWKGLKAGAATVFMTFLKTPVGAFMLGYVAGWIYTRIIRPVWEKISPVLKTIGEFGWDGVKAVINSLTEWFAPYKDWMSGDITFGEALSQSFAAIWDDKKKLGKILSDWWMGTAVPWLKRNLFGESAFETIGEGKDQKYVYDTDAINAQFVQLDTSKMTIDEFNKTREAIYEQNRKMRSFTDIIFNTPMFEFLGHNWTLKEMLIGIGTAYLATNALKLIGAAVTTAQLIKNIAPYAAPAAVAAKGAIAAGAHATYNGIAAAASNPLTLPATMFAGSLVSMGAINQNGHWMREYIDPNTTEERRREILDKQSFWVGKRNGSQSIEDLIASHTRNAFTQLQETFNTYMSGQWNADMNGDFIKTFSDDLQRPSWITWQTSRLDSNETLENVRALKYLRFWTPIRQRAVMTMISKLNRDEVSRLCAELTENKVPLPESVQKFLTQHSDRLRLNDEFSAEMGEIAHVPSIDHMMSASALDGDVYTAISQQLDFDNRRISASNTEQSERLFDLRQGLESGNAEIISMLRIIIQNQKDGVGSRNIFVENARLPHPEALTITGQ